MARPPLSLHPLRTLATAACAVALTFTCAGQAPAHAVQAPQAAEDSRPDHSLGDAEIAFTRGILAFHDGDYEAARAAFTEAVAAAPDDGTYRHWQGLAKLRLGDFNAARQVLEAALAAPLPPAAGRERVRQDLERARREDGEVVAPVGGGELLAIGGVPRFDGRLSLAVGHDSNPHLLDDAVILVAPDGTLIEGEDGDLFGSVDLRLALQPFAGASGAATTDTAWTLGVVADARQSTYGDFGHLDVGSLSARVQLAYGRDPQGYVAGALGYSRVPFGADRVIVLVQAGYGRDWLDGEAFADVAEAGATLRLREGRWGATQLEGEWRDAELDLDPGEPFTALGETTWGRLWQYLYLGSPERWLRVGYASGSRDAGRAYDADLEQIAAELALPLGSRLTLFLAGARRTEDFENPESNLFDPGSGDLREDETTRFGGALVVRLGESVFVTGRATRIERDSALALPFGAPSLDYDRLLASLGISWVF